MRPNQAILKKYLESAKAQGSSLDQVRDTLFPQQDAFVMDLSRLICAQTTVRAGKTTGLGYKFFRAGHKYKRVMMPYIALTRDSAKNIIWPILQEMSDRHKILCDFTEHDLTCTIRKTESSIKLFGADMKNFIPRLKGIKTPLAAVDECQDFRSHLEELIDILISRTSEYADGQVACTGTPGLIPKGYFFNISQGLEGFRTHKWSLFDNPYFPTARDFVDELIKKKMWSIDHPTIQREYFGRWVIDQEARVLHYDEDRNAYDTLPILTDYVIAVDIGHDDADAIAVLGWHKNKKECYLVEEHVKTQQGITELADEIEKRYIKYQPLKIVMDTGGLGKKIASELQQRRELPIVAAEKSRKIEFLALLDDALRTKHFYAKSTTRFASDSLIVRWDYDKSTSDRLVIKEEPHSDIIDAVLYGYREALHWLSEPEKKTVPYKSLGEAWVAHTEKMMNERLEHDIKVQQAEESDADYFAVASMEIGEDNPLKHYLNKRRA